MRAMTRTLAGLTLAASLTLPGGAGTSVLAQAGAAPNSQSNPYRLVMNWARLPAAITWGQVIAFDVDGDGNVYVLHRSDPAVLKFSPTGELLKSWASGVFVQAHGLTVDRFGFIWTTDSDAKDGKGGQVLKWDANGNLLLSLGTKGVLEESPTGRAFVGPTGVAVAANGDVFVSDGHNPGQHGNHRIVKFTKEGTFVRTWGNHTGSANGEVNDPHGIAIDSTGRLFVADRGNQRIEVFDTNGGYLASWPQFGSCENIYITRDDTIYVTDSNSGGTRYPSPYKRGIRIGSTKDGLVRYFIPEESYNPAQTATSGPVGLGVDRNGTIYAADVGTTVGFDRMMKKYVPDTLAAAPLLPLVGESVIIQPPSPGWTLGGRLVSVAVDRRTDVTYVLVRADKTHQPVLAIDRQGRVLRSWGQGLFSVPHNIKVDRQGNVWTTDAGTSRVIKFSPTGKKLLEFVLGDIPTVASGGCAFLANPSNGNLDFCGTTDVAVTPEGRVYVIDGYGKKRVLEYSSKGSRVREWGGSGREPGRFTLPHGLADDGRGVLFVADRDGGRVDRFDRDGRYLGEWSHIGNAGALAFAGGALWAAVAVPTADPPGAAPARRAMWVVKIDPTTGAILGKVETSATDYIDVGENGEVVAGVVAGGFVRYRPLR